jgi:Glyoxalase-like domain
MSSVSRFGGSFAGQIQWLHVFIDVAPKVAEESASFWSAALGWPLGGPWPGHSEFRSFAPPEGDSYIHQQVGNHGPRIHFDVEVADRGAADRLVELGAVVTGQFEGWCPMRSPGGLPFCLVERQVHVRPPAPEFAGHRSRLVQICIDSPPSVHDQEVAFWRTAIGWRWRDGSHDEFAGKLYPPTGSSAQLLFQRLGLDDRATAVRAHIDLGTDDVEAEAARLADLGAEILGPGRGWIVLRDPVGMVFCVTGNSPDDP